MQSERWTIGLALFFATASVLTLFVWIPADIETGVFETFRRRTTIGDAMAPTLAAWAVLLVSIIMGVFSYLRARRSASAPEDGLDSRSYAFLLRISVPLIVGLVLMVYTGPVTLDVLNTFGAELGTYRQQKATFPFKHLGFVAGGFVMIFSLISVVENRMSQSALWVSIFSVAALILLYDVPFDNILIPPNGDF